MAGQGEHGFRADIEGLRGLSVVAVVLFHAFPVYVPGGFIGVDVFFVISGYLITRLLIGELDASGSVDLARFWGRRIRRILPAATVVLISTAALALLFPALDTRALSREILSAALFFNNFRQIGNATDYLGAEHADNPLLHYWSLSVEEQFYLVWPLVLAGAWIAIGRLRGLRRTSVLLIVIGTLWLGSLLYSAHLAQSAPLWAFFDPFSRAWQLLTGALVALGAARWGGMRGRSASAIGVVSLVMLVACFFAISGGVPYPGFVAAVPTLAAAMLIAANAGPGTAAGALLGAAPMRFAGQVSFSWYLWHWPLIVFGRLAWGDAPVVAAAMIVLSFALAALTFRFVEQPVRNGRLSVRPLAATYALGGVLVAAGGASSAAMRHLAPDGVHLGGGVYASARALRRDRPVIYDDGCLLRFADVESPPCIYGAPDGARTVVLFGDSHAGNWFVPLEAAARQEGWRLLVRINASCRPVDAAQTVDDGGRQRAYHECADWRAQVLDEIARLKPDLVVVGGSPHALPLGAELGVLTRLADAAPTIAMRDTPWLPENPVACLRKTQDPARCVWPAMRSANNYPRTPDAEMPPRVRVLDLVENVCPAAQCHAVLDGRVVMFDSNHFTASFAATLSGAFRKLLKSGAPP